MILGFIRHDREDKCFETDGLLQSFRTRCSKQNVQLVAWQARMEVRAYCQHHLTYEDYVKEQLRLDGRFCCHVTVNEVDYQHL